MSTNNYPLAILDASLETKRRALIYILASLAAYFLVSVVLVVFIAKCEKPLVKRGFEGKKDTQELSRVASLCLVGEAHMS